MRKACFVIYSTSSPVITLREIGDDEARPLDFSNDFIAYLVVVFLPVDSDWFISCILDPRFDSLFPYVGHGVMKPHGCKSLR